MNQQGDSRTQLHTNTNPKVPRGVDTNTGLDNRRRPQDQLPAAFRNEGVIQTQLAPPTPPQNQGAIQTQAAPPAPPQPRPRSPSPPAAILPQNQRALQSQHVPDNTSTERVPYGYDKEEQKRIWKNRCLICGRTRHDHWKQCKRECYHCREHLGVRGPNVHVGMACPNTGFNSRWWKDVGGGPIGETNWNKLRIQSLERLVQQKDKKIAKLQDRLESSEDDVARLQERIDRAEEEQFNMQSSHKETIKRLEAELQAAKSTEPSMSNPSRDYRDRDSLKSRSHTSRNHDERQDRQENPRHRPQPHTRSPQKSLDLDPDYQLFLKFKEFQRSEDGHNRHKRRRKSENRSTSPSRKRIPYDSDADKEPMKRSAYLDDPNSPPVREYYAPTIAQPDTRTHIFPSGARSQTVFGQQSPYHQEPTRRSHRQPSHPVVEDDDTFMGGADDDCSEGRVYGKKKKDNYNSRH